MKIIEPGYISTLDILKLFNLMEDYKKTKKVDYVDTMNLIQDAINSLNKAQLKSSKVSMDQNVISIKNTNIHSKKS